MTLPGPSEDKGNPVVISKTEGEEITPDNPEIIKQFPVDLSNQTTVDIVENTETVDRSQRSNEWLRQNPE